MATAFRIWLPPWVCYSATATGPSLRSTRYSWGGSPLPGGTSSIALQGVNADNILDVTVADQHTVKVQLGNGDGTLQDPLPFKSAGYRPLSVAVADVNRDGFPDVVVANEY